VPEDNMAAIRPVVSGVRLRGKVEILEGLQPGERVIVEGHQKVGPGSPVNPLDSSAGQPRHSSPEQEEQTIEPGDQPELNPPDLPAENLEADSQETNPEGA